MLTDFADRTLVAVLVAAGVADPAAVCVSVVAADTMLAPLLLAPLPLLLLLPLLLMLHLAKCAYDLLQEQQCTNPRA